MGGDLRGNWGTVPPKLEGGRPMHPSPQYFEKYSVVGCVRKYELSKIRCHQGIIFFKNRGFFRQERDIYVIYHISHSKDRQNLKKQNYSSNAHRGLHSHKWRCM